METPQARVYLKCELGEREILINIVVQFLCSCSQVSSLQMRIEIVFRQVARVRESLMEERKSWCRSVLAPPDHCLPSQGPLSLFLSVYFQYFSRCIFGISLGVFSVFLSSYSIHIFLLQEHLRCDVSFAFLLGYLSRFIFALTQIFFHFSIILISILISHLLCKCWLLRWKFFSISGTIREVCGASLIQSLHDDEQVYHVCFLI